MKKFVFLSAGEESFRREISAGARDYVNPEIRLLEKSLRSFDSEGLHKKEIDARITRSREFHFTKLYATALNTAIGCRYKAEDYRVFLLVPRGDFISDIVNVAQDYIIIDGIWEADKGYRYALDRVIQYDESKTEELVIAGFNLMENVNKFAKLAYYRGINVRVDEDLTDLLKARVKKYWFSPGCQTSTEPRHFDFNKRRNLMESYIAERADKPWFGNLLRCDI